VRRLDAALECAQDKGRAGEGGVKPPHSKVPSAQPYRGDHQWPVLADRCDRADPQTEGPRLPEYFYHQRFRTPNPAPRSMQLQEKLLDAWERSSGIDMRE
jgi:hypothetical protein